MRRTILTLCAVMFLLTSVGVTPVSAFDESIDLACPTAIITPSGFTDVDPTSVHKDAIDCVAFWSIAQGTSPTTFNPKGEVTRWQMALFLTRTFGWIWGDLTAGGDQGFTDIAALPQDVQTAINQLKELSITSGTTPTTFTPNGTLTRWQMALFLTRLLTVMGSTLPDGADQGFTDIGSLDASARTAINQMKELGITAGTAPTTFSPNGIVTREQMASFIARTLQATQDLALLGWYTGSCADESNCTYGGTFPANRRFAVREGWATTPLPGSADFFATSTRVELLVDGSPVTLNTKVIIVNNAVFKYFEAGFPGMTGVHTFVITWYNADQLTLTSTYIWTFG